MSEADIVILDRQLPEGDSLTWLSQWKQIKDVPVILLTALVSVRDKVTGLDSGANDYLTKPFAGSGIAGSFTCTLTLTRNR